jgi:hypothetical protein
MMKKKVKSRNQVWVLQEIVDMLIKIVKIRIITNNESDIIVKLCYKLNKEKRYEWLISWFEEEQSLRWTINYLWLLTQRWDNIVINEILVDILTSYKRYKQ